VTFLRYSSVIVLLRTKPLRSRPTLCYPHLLFRPSCRWYYLPRVPAAAPILFRGTMFHPTFSQLSPTLAHSLVHSFNFQVKGETNLLSSPHCVDFAHPLSMSWRSPPLLLRNAVICPASDAVRRKKGRGWGDQPLSFRHLYSSVSISWLRTHCGELGTHTSIAWQPGVGVVYVAFLSFLEVSRPGSIQRCIGADNSCGDRGARAWALPLLNNWFGLHPLIPFSHRFIFISSSP